MQHAKSVGRLGAHTNLQRNSDVKDQQPLVEQSGSIDKKTFDAKTAKLQYQEYLEKVRKEIHDEKMKRFVTKTMIEGKHGNKDEASPSPD